MLQSLRVKNLAIVENILVELQPGLNVITGETGAGKSVLIGALGLLLGERADKSLIRAGEDACGVEASFALTDCTMIDRILEELGIHACDGGHLIIRRIVSASGGNKILVNDCPATLQTLARLGTLLVDMHGPHDHQSLLDRDFQLDLLDAAGHLDKPRAAYEQTYRSLLDLEQERQALDGDDKQVSQRLELLTYQVQEIESAALSAADESDLEQEHATVANAQQILAIADTIRTAVTDDEASAFSRMVFVQSRLDELIPLLPDAQAWKQEAAGLALALQELADTVNRAATRIEADPARLQWLEDRMSEVHKLKRKYGGTVAAVLEHGAACKQQLRDLETRGERVAELDRDLAAARAAVKAAGGTLSLARHKCATSLAKAITAELKELGFAHGRFFIDLQTSEPRPSGLDAIEFGFAPNAGEPMRPLRLIASSGEISRVMLAIKTVVARHDRIPVLIFDEIDANVGGEMGTAIGAKLASVAATHQVLCITHLPQVAVYGQAHYVVHKEVSDGRTRTLIRTVENEARAEEVARMLGGKDLTSVTLRHAREMLKRH